MMLFHWERAIIYLLVLSSSYNVFVYLLFLDYIVCGHDNLLAGVMFSFQLFRLLAPFTRDCLWAKQSIWWYFSYSVTLFVRSLYFNSFICKTVGLLSSNSSFSYVCFLCLLSLYASIRRFVLDEISHENWHGERWWSSVIWLKSVDKWTRWDYSLWLSTYLWQRVTNRVSVVEEFEVRMGCFFVLD